MSACTLRRALLATAALFLAPAGPAAAAEGDYVVVLRGGVDADATTARLERGQGFGSSQRYGAAVKGFAARLSDTQAQRVRQDPSVAYVAPDRSFAADGTVPLAATETVPAGIRRIRAATATTARTPSDAGVAVLDTGLDLANADLNAASGINCVTSGASAQDDNGHGTHVAGTLAGRNTGAGVVGVAPGTRLHAVKVLDGKANGSLSRLLCGLDWVTRNAAALKIRVVSMSVSGAGTNDSNCGQTNADPLHAAICAATAAGITVVASAGNTNVSIQGRTPASYPEVLTVTAMTDTDGLPGAKGPAACSKTEVDDRPWSSSNFAVTAGDAAHVVAAPGTCVVSSKRGGGTATMSGTSMATPHVAGAVALCLGSGGVPGPCAGLTPEQTIRRIRSDAEAAGSTGFGFTGDPLRAVAGKVFGHLVSAATY